MLKRVFLFSLLVFAWACHSFAQIQGVVKDADTGEPLPFVNIFYEGKGVGAISDIDGRFNVEKMVEWKALTFSSVGYTTEVVPITAKTKFLTVTMKVMDHTLDEVVVRPKREKYSRKNNPAVELMKKVVAAKELDDLKQKDYYSYNIYQKLTLALNNITADSLRESKLFKQYPFFREQVEYCAEIDKNILPLSVDETLTQTVYRKKPESEKNIIKGLNSTGVNELFNTGDMLTTVLKDVFQNVNVYEDRVRLLQYPFDSPISDNGIGFYRYYIMDTIYVEQDKCFHLSFVPNNSQDFGFTGHLYIMADSTFRLKQCVLNLPKKTDVNFVEDMQILQQFGALPTGEWVQLTDDMLCELNFFGGHFMVRRVTHNSDYSFLEVPERIFKKKGKEIKDVNAMMRNDEFWNRYRATELTESESNMSGFVDNLAKIKGFKYLLFGLKALIENFVETGTKDHPSKVDIGPINTMITSNYIDGMRLRASAQTTANLNPNWFFKGYVAYGFKDERMKYLGQVEYSFDKKGYLPREFPKHSIAVSYQYDNMLPSDKFINTDKDNVFTSLKWAKQDLYNYERKFTINYEHERENGLKTSVMLRHANYEPCGRLFYRTMKGESQLQQAIAEGSITGESFMHTPFNTKDITVAEATLGVRYAPGETFVNTKQRRLPINLDAPVFSLSHTFGINGLLGSEYKYNFTEAGAYKRLWLGSWGNIDTYLKGGIQWNKVPFPLLIMPAANLSYIIQDGTFNLINNMEFLNDRYASLDISWNMQGKLFNRIPLLKKLKWREFIGIKCLWGELTDKNNPFLEENRNDDVLMKFPGHYRANGVYDYSSNVLDPKKPYIEACVGIHNIFKLLHVEYVRRLNYNELPTANKWGIRLMIRTVF
ncbi:MAG: carboxypeptidase-like regulatory domain-containing protein [Bacteroides sp.]|nr:carboxypeptidase-like regulatory domain-containing protein [Bacteroides sp.]